MARVLVTGATGFVGGRLTHALRARGDDVTALVRSAADHLDAVGVDQVTGGFDAADEGLLDRCDVVVHAAASVDADIEVAREINQVGTRTLIDLAGRAGTGRFVHVSTTAVYDLAAVGDATVDEEAPLVAPAGDAPATSSASSSYAITKAEGEAEVVRGAAKGLSVAVLRPPAVLGAGPTSTWGTRIPTRLRDGGWAPPHPATTYAWVHVDDLVDAIVAAIDQPVDATMHVIGGHAKFGAYVDALAASVPGIERTDPGEPELSSRRWLGSYTTDRLPALLGVRPERSFDDAMAEIGSWWATQGVE